MPHHHNNRETEIKLAVPSASAARSLLREAGFSVSRRRVFERNAVFDTPDLRLRNAGALLRVRQAGRTATLTYKGPAVPGKHKSREELETVIPDAGLVSEILARLGYVPVFHYEKRRRIPGTGGRPAMDRPDRKETRFRGRRLYHR